MNPKQRLSASVDADLLRAAEAAVVQGRSDSVSAWVNDALRLKAEHDTRLAALAEFIAEYESRHGVISPEEMKAASQRARRRRVTGIDASRSALRRTASKRRTSA